MRCSALPCATVRLTRPRPSVLPPSILVKKSHFVRGWIAASSRDECSGGSGVWEWPGVGAFLFCCRAVMIIESLGVFVSSVWLGGVLPFALCAVGGSARPLPPSLFLFNARVGEPVGLGEGGLENVMSCRLAWWFVCVVGVVPVFRFFWGGGFGVVCWRRCARVPRDLFCGSCCDPISRLHSCNMPEQHV